MKVIKLDQNLIYLGRLRIKGEIITVPDDWDSEAAVKKTTEEQKQKIIKKKKVKHGKVK